jgi:hypothetical protein
MSRTSGNDPQHSATAARKEELADQAARAMRAYNDRIAATNAKTARLRALRMARDAEAALAAPVRTGRKKRSTAV